MNGGEYIRNSSSYEYEIEELENKIEELEDEIKKLKREYGFYKWLSEIYWRMIQGKRERRKK